MRQTNKRKTTIILIVMLMLLVEIIILGFSRANNIKEIQTTIKDYGKNLKEDNDSHKEEFEYEEWKILSNLKIIQKLNLSYKKAYLNQIELLKDEIIYLRRKLDE